MTQAENKSLFDELVDICVQENGSDLHVSEDRTPIIRVDGFLIPLVKKQKLTRENIEGFLSLILSEGNLEEFKARKEVDFGYTHDKKARFRGNAYFELGKISIALRLIPQKIRTLAELNLPPSLEQFAHKQQGFFLVVGPAGHGKTTTLAALIDIINHERLEHVITIESPIEYIFTEDKSLVDQREVKIDTPSFHDALRGIFRQDIDILMISKGKAGIDKIAREIYAKYGREINTIIITPDDFRKQRNKDLIKEIINNHYIIYGVERFVDLVFR